MAEESLKNKTIKGVAWSGIDNVAQFGVSFIVSIVLARLLSPSDYGLIGIVGIFTSLCATIIDGGFRDSLIRKKDATDADYNTTFIINFVVSILLYVVIYFCAGFIADFFKQEILVNLIRVSSVGIIIGAVAIVQRTILTKKLDFKTQTKVTFIASLFSAVVGISMALLGYGVWSLVAQGLSITTMRTVLFCFYNRWWPTFIFSKKSFDELFGFGWKLMASEILDTLWKELNQVVVGKFYSPATLGQYTRANSFSQLFSSNLTIVVQRVTYPVLSNIQDDKERMVNAYRRVIKMTMFVTVICMFFLGAISEPLLYCLIGPKWHEASTYLPLICICASMYPLHAINLNMLQVQGRSDIFLILEIIKKIILLGPLVVGAVVGIMAMLYVSLFTTIICYFLNSHYSGKYLGYSSWMQLKDIAPSYFMAIILAVPVFFIKYLPFSPWLLLPSQIVLGVIIFVIVNRLFVFTEFTELKSIVAPYVLNLIGRWKK